MACYRTPLSAPAGIPIDCLKIVSWNVAGLRGVLKNCPHIFTELETVHKPDIICLQETKIQTTNESDFNNIFPSYQKFWCSSVTKKGYSGTAIFVKGNESCVPEMKKQSTLVSLWGAKKRKRGESKSESELEILPDPTTDTSTTSSTHGSVSTFHPLTVLNVNYELKDEIYCGEGRTITIEFPHFYIVNCYVPNSGQRLERLSYRINEWDPYITKYLKSLESTGKPVIFAGDLNVAHLDLDIHNPTAKHLSKQAGVTPEERTSFGTTLANEFQDAFRFFYPEHEGQFTYWSVRTNARPENKGLRLDYFMCSKDIFTRNLNEEDDREDGRSIMVRDCGILHEFGVGCSDHCPITLSLQIL